MVYKVGIIGTGFGAKVHLPSYQAHSGFEVVSIAGRNTDKTKTIAEEAGIDFTTNWPDLLKQREIDIISISTPPYLHYQMAKMSLESKKHILLEKPTTSNATEAKKLYLLADSLNLIALMAHEFRWIPSRKMLQQLLYEEKAIGRVREIHMNIFFDFVASPEKPLFGWLWESRFDGGLLGALGSHQIDMIRAITGTEFAEVQGQVFTRTKKRKNSHGGYSKVTADDGFSMIFTLEDGTNGIMNASGTISPAPSTRVIFSGTEGTCYIDGNKIFLAKYDQEFQEITPLDKFKLDTSLETKDGRIPPFLRLLDQLEKSLNEGNSLIPNLYDGWQNQQVIDAIRLSGKTGNMIKITDFI